LVHTGRREGKEELEKERRKGGEGHSNFFFDIPGIPIPNHTNCSSYLQQP
jgi:hypothetical protein